MFSQSRYIGILVLASLPCAAKAATFKVSSPYIEVGKAKVEWQGFYGVDDQDSKNTAWKQNLLLGYGINKYWKTQLRTVYEKGGEGDGPDITATSFDNVFALTQPGEHYFDAAVKFDYVHFYTGAIADNISTRLILGKTTPEFQHLVNFRVTHNIGENTNNSGGIAFSTKYRYSAELQPGIEIYNDFGSLDKTNAFRNQNRSVGPVLNGRVQGVDYQAGVLFGLTDDTPDETFKLSFGYQF